MQIFVVDAILRIVKTLKSVSMNIIILLFANNKNNFFSFLNMSLFLLQE